MKDLLKIIAYSSVYCLQIYGAKYVGLDTGKNNLESYFVNKLRWSKTRLIKNVRILKESGILTKVPSDVGCTCFKISTCRQLIKNQLLLL